MSADSPTQAPPGVEQAPTSDLADPRKVPDTLTEAEVRAALAIARRLAELGVPIFVAPPQKGSTTGFALPTGWQHTTPDPAVVDAWRPGYALCAVMGAGLDLLDVDPRNGGLDSLARMNGSAPHAYATAATPSGGWHYLIASLGVGSRDKTYPGIDVKGGLAGEESRGFAFISPTEKPSKAPEHQGATRPYRWSGEPRWDELGVLLEHGPEGLDNSGAQLAARVLDLRRYVAKPRETPQAPGLLGEWARQKEPQAQAAAERAINQKLADIRDWDPAGDFGGRQTVLRAALTLGGYVGGGYLDEDTARERLLDACAERWGSADQEDRLWVTQGVTDGQRSPFLVYTPEQEAEWTARELAAEAEYQARAAQHALAERYEVSVPTLPVPQVVQDWYFGPDMLETSPQGPPAVPGPGHTAPAPPSPPEQAGPHDGTEPPPGPPPPPFSVYRHLGPDPFDPAEDGSDQGLAEAVAARTRPVLRYGADSGTWLVRGADRWVEREGMDTWAVATLARMMPLGQTPVPKEVSERTEDHWRAVRRAAFMSSAGAGKVAGKLRAIVRNSDHPSSLEVGDLDAEAEVLWAGGAPWDLRRSTDHPQLARIDPNTPHLHTALCAPQPIETPLWDAFTVAVFPDPAVRSWALRVLSVALAGYPDAVVPILCGPERTGKSSLVALIVRVLGTYGHAADPRLLSSGESHASIVYALKGRRLSFLDEGPRGTRGPTEKLKQLTGGAQLTGNAMRANPITFDPTHTLVMTSNEEPPLTDPALMARIRVIPCEADQAAVRRAREALSPDEWAAEAPGVLAALMRECGAWLADRDSAGLAAAPEVLRVSISEMEAAQNPVTRWVEEVCVPAEPGTPARDLFRAYLAWHKQQDELDRVQMPSQTAFGRKVTALGYPLHKIRVGDKTLWYRSLSVRGGGGYGPPIMPQPPVPSRGAPDPGTNLPHEHGTSQSPRSDPISSYVVPCVPGTTPYIDSNITHHPNRVHIEEIQEKTGKSDGTQNTGGESSGADLAVPEAVPYPVATRNLPEGGHGEVTKNDHNTSEVSRTAVLPTELPPGLPEGFDPLRSVTVGQKRLWAAAGCTEVEAAQALKAYKAEHRARERAEAKRLDRQERVASASGPELALPVAVNRALEVTPIDADEALPLGRAILARSGGVLTIDMENTGYALGHRHYGLRTAQLGDEHLSLVLHPVDHAEAVRTLLAEAAVLEAHSGQADLVAFAAAGLCEFDEAMGRLRDTAIRARLSDPTITGQDGDLKRVSPKVLGDAAVTPTTEAARKALFDAGGWLENTQADTPPERSGWATSSATGTTMLRYAGGDVLDTAAIGRRIPPIPDWLDARERVVHQMTARVTYRGVPLDQAKIRELKAHHQPERDRLTAEIVGFPGTAIENPGSPKQLAEAFQLGLGVTLPLTKPDRLGRGGGSPCTAEHVLKVIKTERSGTAPGELARLVLEWREHKTALDTFIGPYAQLCELGDGRARPTIYTVGTNTGRTSCVRPNAQQLPRQGGFRAMYGADPGYVIVRADFAAVEIRGAGALSGDQTLLESIKASDALGAEAKADLHWVVARQAYGPQATKEDRYQVKPAVFARLYGGGAATIAEQVGRTEREVAEIIDALDAVTPTYRAWAKRLIGEAKAGRKAFEAYSGRLIWFTQPSSAPNYAVQGSCREALVDALLRWRETRWGGCTILPVHDELLAWVPAEDAHEATAALVECMTSSLTGLATVPIKAEPDPQVDGRWTGFTRWPDAS